jgi:pyruvate formate lyase activating enzyme
MKKRTAMVIASKTFGLITLIQRFSVQDGPGIRSTIFLKGCSLTCWWCQNPETWFQYSELIAKDEKCNQCGNCVNACPVDAVRIDKSVGRYIDRTNCNNCLKCVSVCPTGALEKIGRYMTIEDVMTEVERDELFYNRSKGGVTISGGEPLIQWKFVRKLLKELKYRGLHTALDTSGHGKWSILEKLLEYSDLILYDIKHMNSAIHRQGTGVGNELILKNIRKIPMDKKIWLRVPLIPGYNISHENITNIAYLAKEIRAEKVSILPFHRLGESKYKGLGRYYSASILDGPDASQISYVKSIFMGHGIKVSIGS